MADVYLTKITSGGNLTYDESHEMMRLVGSGGYSPVEVSSILTALRVKGETVNEIAGCAAAFRELAVGVPHKVKREVFDCCGTGGDGAGTFNISTAAAFVTATLGISTAKHGNRAVSSKSGSADVLEALGVRIDLSPDGAARCLEETDFCFLFAPNYHPAMKHVAPVRKELGIPTVFNMLGPLLNPAGCTHQIIGTPDKAKAKTISRVASRLGLNNVTVLTTSLGIDELIFGSDCHLFRTNHSGIDEKTLRLDDPDRMDIEDLAGGDAAENARILRSIFGGEKSIRSSVVALNAALGLAEMGRFDNLDAARSACGQTIESGVVLTKLEQVIELSNKLD
jgi:anthranilate phosphoribosyltransferase